MELTPVQRLVAFAAVVLVLAGLGVYLFLPKSSGAAGRSPAPTTAPSQPASQPSPQPAEPPGTGSTPPPAGSGKAPDIYGWLPFTASGLASAAKVTTTFAADYGTSSYRQSTASYLAPMKQLMTSQLAALIGRAYSAPGVVAQRNSAKDVTAGSAQITSLRAFGPSSLTFVVAISEKISSTNGPGTQSTDYAITVTGSGSSWQVSNIEFASAGNQ